MASESDTRRAGRQTRKYNGMILLSIEDRKRFAEALLNAPLPNAALLEAKRRHAMEVEVRQQYLPNGWADSIGIS